LILHSGLSAIKQLTESANVIYWGLGDKLFVSWEKSLSYKNAGQVGFAAGQVDFQVTCPAG